jgi:hypothetical protein
MKCRAYPGVTADIAHIGKARAADDFCAGQCVDQVSAGHQTRE